MFLVEGTVDYLTQYLKEKRLLGYVVAFVDYDGTALKRCDNVAYGTLVKNIKPNNPTRVGYNFTGWTQPDNYAIVGDTTITAQYTEIPPETTETIYVNVKVSFPYEHPMAVSGTVYVKYGSTIVGTGSYSGTHWYGFSTTIGISCTYPTGKKSNLTLSYANAYPSGWNPTLSFN